MRIIKFRDRLSIHGYLAVCLSKIDFTWYWPGPGTYYFGLLVGVYSLQPAMNRLDSNEFTPSVGKGDTFSS